jgi:uncharacterized protein YndB with AHSA1/START domain
MSLVSLLAIAWPDRTGRRHIGLPSRGVWCGVWLWRSSTSLRAESASNNEPPARRRHWNKVKFYGRAEYLKIEQPGRTVYTQQFCNEDEEVSRHPMAPTWQETMLTAVQLTDEGADRTRVTVTWEAHGATMPEELDIFIKSKGGMTQGWTGSFDKLDAYLSNN